MGGYYQSMLKRMNIYKKLPSFFQFQKMLVGILFRFTVILLSGCHYFLWVSKKLLFAPSTRTAKKTKNNGEKREGKWMDI